MCIRDSQSINKKMKDYLNLFYGMIDKIHSWDELDIESKNSILVNFLDKKQGKLTINKSNKNDILKLLGSPSTKSTFDNDLWIYIERKTDSSSLTEFGSERILVNNVLLLEINNMGLLEKKEFLDLLSLIHISEPTRRS